MKSPSSNTNRRANKPLMERRRRARINEYLDQLKDMVLTAMKKENPNGAKLEKADILEMTVDYLKGVHRSQKKTADPVSPPSGSIYQAGFNHCANEVQKYLLTSGVNEELRMKLVSKVTENVNIQNSANEVAMSRSGLQCTHSQANGNLDDNVKLTSNSSQINKLFPRNEAAAENSDRISAVKAVTNCNMRLTNTATDATVNQQNGVLLQPQRMQLTAILIPTIQNGVPSNQNSSTLTPPSVMQCTNDQQTGVKYMPVYRSGQQNNIKSNASLQPVQLQIGTPVYFKQCPNNCVVTLEMIRPTSSVEPEAHKNEPLWRPW